MLISSCLKIQVGSTPAKVSSFFEGNFQDSIDDVSGSKLDDLIVFSHLVPFFSGGTDWMFARPPTAISTPMTQLGFVADSDSNSSHPENSLSLECFKAQSLKYQIAEQVPTVNGDEVMDSAEWFSLIMGTPIENLNAVIQENAPNNNINLVVFNEPIVLKITRSSPSDILTLPTIIDSDYPPYTDAFDKVKACLVNNVSVLNDKGLSPAVYHADGDYITFTADCYFQFSFSLPVAGGGLSGGGLPSQ